ncbi:MAG TPA: hypothetical protein DCZ94_20745 [Lentisphaeria bacterium]|nr:MAG: hypothetical protein A2X48_09105 [Lentisphaerae bacterium GWF2_49_21]HBC89376.1 hypothetical protein [Lentisphaeria bacterium]
MKKAGKKPDLPKYSRLKEVLKADILSGRIDDRLPGEFELAKRFKMSYMTVRKAVGELVEEGLLYRVSGEGTFVSRPGRRRDKRNQILFSLLPGINLSKSPYYAEVLGGVDQAASEKGYFVIVSNSDLTFTDKGEISRKNIRLNVDGIITPVRATYDDIRMIGKFIPIIIYGHYESEACFPQVYSDSYKAGLRMMEYLYENGHRKMARIMNIHERDKTTKNRTNAYYEFFKKKKMKVNEKYLFEIEYSKPGAGRAGAEYFASLKDRPTVIMCHNDAIAAEVIMCFQEKGIRVPKDISVFGYSNSQIASQVYPGISTVDINSEMTGSSCVDLLFSIINGQEDMRNPRKVEIPTNLVIRGSTRSMQVN